MSVQKILKFCCLTYNLNQKSLSEEQIRILFLPHIQKDFDIYIIATQECERSILLNLIYDDKSSFEFKLKNFFGEDFFNLEPITLGGIHLIIFAKKKYKFPIKNYENNHIKTGFRRLFSNKGAVSIFVNIFNFSFLIINSHFNKGKDKLSERNDDSSYIYESINPKIDKINVVIWMGCLNYKVDAELSEFSEAYIKGKELSLLKKDEMIKERKYNNSFIFKKFNEGKINFLPSSKYQIGTNKINWTDKENYPSWADRIFYKIYQNARINFSFDLIKYDCMNDISFSDHKPVYAYFNFDYSNI